MLAALLLVLVLSRLGRLSRTEPVVLLGGYTVFVAVSATVA